MPARDSALICSAIALIACNYADLVVYIDHLSGQEESFIIEIRDQNGKRHKGQHKQHSSIFKIPPYLLPEQGGFSIRVDAIDQDDCTSSCGKLARTMVWAPSIGWPSDVHITLDPLPNPKCTWERADAASSVFWSVTPDAAGGAWLVGQQQTPDTEGILLHLDGTDLGKADPPLSSIWIPRLDDTDDTKEAPPLRSVASTADGKIVWAAGDAGTLLRFDATAGRWCPVPSRGASYDGLPPWVQQRQQDGPNFWQVAVGKGGDRVWLANDGPETLYCEGCQSTGTFQLVKTPSLRAVWIDETDPHVPRVWLGGAGGEILAWKRSALTGNLNSAKKTIWGFGATARHANPWAIGIQGTFLEYHDSATPFTEVMGSSPLPTVELRAIWGGEQSSWVIGHCGTLLHYSDAASGWAAITQGQPWFVGCVPSAPDFYGGITLRGGQNLIVGASEVSDVNRGTRRGVIYQQTDKGWQVLLGMNQQQP